MTTRQSLGRASSPGEIVDRSFSRTETSSEIHFPPPNPPMLEPGPHYSNNVTLPSFDSLCRTLQHPAGPTPSGPGERVVVSRTQGFNQPPVTIDTFSELSVTSTASSPIDRFTLLSPEVDILVCPTVAGVNGDKFSTDHRERALAAKQIINHHFGHLSWYALKTIKANVDTNRPLYGTDAQSSNRGPKSTKKHSVAERERRDYHSVMFREQDRRMPTQIMELAGHPTGSRKPPGKHHLHVAGILMLEFDSLIQARMEQEIFDPRGQLHQRNGTEYVSSSDRRRLSEMYRADDTSSCGSPRKRKRDHECSGASVGMPPPPSPARSNCSSRVYLSPRLGTPSSSSSATW
jgi:hypothetical protein